VIYELVERLGAPRHLAEAEVGSDPTIAAAAPTVAATRDAAPPRRAPVPIADEDDLVVIVLDDDEPIGDEVGEPDLAMAGSGSDRA
jgi:hypothetical protein